MISSEKKRAEMHFGSTKGVYIRHDERKDFHAVRIERPDHAPERTGVNCRCKRNSIYCIDNPRPEC